MTLTPRQKRIRRSIHDLEEELKRIKEREEHSRRMGYPVHAASLATVGRKIEVKLDKLSEIRL